jgi:thiamine-monophosphate kinase
MERGLARLAYPQCMKPMRKDSAIGVTQSGELDLIRHIRARAGQAAGAALRLGIGDDCALLRPRRGEELAVTTDLSIAGRHFRLDWHQPQSIGHRALARGLSDLAAMGARPIAAFLSLGLPRGLITSAGRRPAWVDSFLEGLLQLAAAHKTPLAGGDLSESPIPIADIVLIGAVPRGKALLRSTARLGHLLYVTGALGGAAAALAKLAELAENPSKSSRGLQEHNSIHALKGRDFSRAANAKKRAEALAPEGGFSGSAALDFRRDPPRIPKKLEAQLAPHLYPQPCIAQGLWLVRHNLASAAIDISDGLSTELAHICEESHVAAEVDAALLPIHPAATLAQALNGGEGYELLFTAPANARIPRKIAGVPITRIGRIIPLRRSQSTVTLVTAQGREPLNPSGWQHFS